MNDLHALLADIFSISEQEISDDLQLQSISSWDSMTHISLISGLEKKYEFQMTGDEIADIKTVQDIKEILQKYDKL